MTPVKPTSARSKAARRSGDHPPRSEPRPAPKAAAPSAAAGLTNIVPPVSDFGEAGFCRTGVAGTTGAGSLGAGPGPDATVREVLGRRELTHGFYGRTSSVAAAIRNALGVGLGYHTMSPGKRIAVDEIALKLARIVCGDPNYPDHWIDIAGYAEKALAN